MSDGKIMYLIILKDGRKGCSHTKIRQNIKEIPAHSRFKLYY